MKKSKWKNHEIYIDTSNEEQWVQKVDFNII